MTEKILKKYKNNIYSVLDDEEDKNIFTFDEIINYINKDINKNISNLEKKINNININNKTNDNSSILGKRKYDNNISYKSKYLGCGIFD